MDRISCDFFEIGMVFSHILADAISVVWREDLPCCVSVCSRDVFTGIDHHVDCIRHVKM